MLEVSRCRFRYEFDFSSALLISGNVIFRFEAAVFWLLFMGVWA